MKRYIVALALGALALLALACAPAQQPTAAPAPAAPGAEATAAPEPTAVPVSGEVSTEGNYIERAGLRLFIPKGFEFGGPVIPPDPRSPRYGGTAIQAIPGDPPSIDPYHTTSYQAQRHNAIVYDRLIHYNVKAGVDLYNNPMIPGLAESWEISDDGLTYTFHLRKGVKFHSLPPVNGRELDAEDIQATVALFKDPGSVIKANFANVERVEAVDRYTVAFHLKEVDPGMLIMMTDSTRTSILPREMTDPASHVRRQAGIGTGPFMVDKPYEYKVGISYKRNPDYWQFDERGNRLPYLDRYQIAVIADANARLTAFRTGKIDYGAEVTGGLVGFRALLKTNPTTLFQGYLGRASGCLACLRLDKEPWNDVRVRRAMMLAIDLETYAQALNSQPPLVVGSHISGLYHGSDDSLTTVTEVCGCPWYTYDPQRARALLAEAGFPNGFSTDIAMFAYSQSTIEAVELMVAYWKAIGVDVKILNQDYTVYRRNVDLGGWENIGLSFMCCGAVTVYQIMEALIPGGPRNPQMGWTNDPKMTALAKQVIASYRDPAARKELVRQARAYYLDQVFLIPGAYGVSYIFFSPRLRNFQPILNLDVGTDYRQWLYTWIDDDWSFAK